MATDYISRDAALDFLIPRYGTSISDADARTIGERFAEHIEEIPAADVRENVHGTWTRVDYEPVGHDYTCSVCQRKNAEPSKFCPNCGAKMRWSDTILPRGAKMRRSDNGTS